MTVVASGPSVGELLRVWRERRRFSQQELSNRSEVSTRHLSRVETGKAMPTAQMILRLADRLDVPLRDRNRLLLSAGFAPGFDEREVDDADLAVVMDGLRSLLDAYLPYPALLLDDQWDIVDTNSAVDGLLDGCAPWLLEPPVNVVRLCLHPDGIGGRIHNREAWGGELLSRLRHRAERSYDPRHEALLAELSGYAASTDRCSTTGPVLTLEIDLNGTRARFFSVSAQLDTAIDVTLDGLHLETFLPADQVTRDLFGNSHSGQSS